MFAMLVGKGIKSLVLVHKCLHNICQNNVKGTGYEKECYNLIGLLYLKAEENALGFTYLISCNVFCCVQQNKFSVCIMNCRACVCTFRGRDQSYVKGRHSAWLKFMEIHFFELLSNSVLKVLIWHKQHKKKICL